MGLDDFIRPKPDDADEISADFIKSRAGSILPTSLSFQNAPRASDRRERVIRMAQYYIWCSLHQDLSPSAKRKRAMSRVEDELDDVNRKKLLNAVYDLYEGRAEGANAVEQFEADLEQLSVVYEQYKKAA